MLKVGHYIERPGRTLDHAPVTIPVAKELEAVPGIPINSDDVDFYSREYPIEAINITERSANDWGNRIREGEPEMREIRKEHNRLNNPLIQASLVTGEIEPTAKATGQDVSGKIQAKARELGFGEVGFTKYDHHYSFQHKKSWVKFPNAICLAYEQAYEPTQSIPSIPAEIVHTSTYRIENAVALDLADYIRSLGYHAQVHSPTDGTSVYIPMFVQAGLGQLGANGQLLSPHFGSRARIMLITTDARVTYDQPIDYGVHRFCQICQVCVNRCPGRALMREKVWWRGVEKNKLIYKRCRPVMARYQDCGICMKACPVQRYGMKSVMEHYVATGQVLGKGTHSLEGYELEGKGYFGPGELPSFDYDFFSSLPIGTAEQYVLEQFKKKFQDVDSMDTPGGEALFEDFRAKLVSALGLNPDFFAAQEEELPDYLN